jgi:hypothetical protein
MWVSDIHNTGKQNSCLPNAAAANRMDTNERFELNLTRVK